MNSPAYCADKADLVRLVEAATDELIESCGRPGTCIISTGSFARVAPFHETSAHAVREVNSICVAVAIFRQWGSPPNM